MIHLNFVYKQIYEIIVGICFVGKILISLYLIIMVIRFETKVSAK